MNTQKSITIKDWLLKQSGLMTEINEKFSNEQFVNLFPQDKGDIFKMTETPAGVVLISDNRQYLYDSVDKVIESKKWFIINEV